MKSINLALLLVVLLILFAGWFFYARLDDFFFPPTSSVQKSVGQPGPSEEEDRSVRLPIPPHHPVPPVSASSVTPPQANALPLPATLDQADAYLNVRLPQLIADRDLLALLNLNHFVQKLVLFIDHLPEKSLPRLHLPLIPPPPGFITSGSGEQGVIGKRNAARYTPYVKLVEAIPDAHLLQLYRGLYPLLQQAYRETSGPNAYFNDRFIQVIDDLLETPEPREPISVVHHVSRFKYADASFEARSAGQKILLRMGVENTRRVKAKLQRLRQELVRKDW